MHPETLIGKTTFQWPEYIHPPSAKKYPKTLTVHGDTRVDDYYWLNEKENPETISTLEAENEYLEQMMSGAKELQQHLFEEMKGRIKEKDESVPVFKNGYFYYIRFEEGQQYYKYCRKKDAPGAEEEIVLNVDEMAKGHGYYSVTGFNVSPDNRMIAYGVDTIGRRQYIIYIKDLFTGEIYADHLLPCSGNSVWGNDNITLFYTETNPVTLLSERIKKHILGDDPASDVTVFEETDKSNYIGVGKTRSGKYIIINSRATMSSETWILDADQPGKDFKVFQPRIKNVLYSVDHSRDQFLIITNDQARNFRMMETPLEKTSRENWKEVIPHREDVLLQGVDPFSEFIVITERKHGLIRLRIRKLENQQEFYLDFGEPVYTASIGVNPEYKTMALRFNYTSLTTPVSVFDYDMKTGEKKLLKQQEVVGGYDASLYQSERIFVKAGDGAEIPVSVVYKRDFVKNGKGPLLLYGYGAYGASMDVSFSAARLSLLDRGFAFAIAHVRGGQEMGRAWYEDGKLMKKKNTFTDFIDCAEYLVLQKFTSPGHLYAMGGSAGGLLIGAVANMRPDLWNGLIASVPFVDVVTTMLDESIPLTTNEFDEWGNPKNPEAYEYMKSYSPYDNVGDACPNMLVTTGLHDSQVQYFEPAKWVARIREKKKDNNVLLFHINMKAGHGGASGRFDYLKEVAMQYTFLLCLEGKT